MKKAIFLLFAGIFAAGFLASAADALYVRQAGPVTFKTPIDRILGGAKEAVGSALYLKADTYFHGGTEALGEETAEEMNREGLVGGGPHREAPQDWIAKINERVKSHEHRHLTEDEQKEMLPFFHAALALDPKNVDAVLTASYWLNKHMNKPREAAAILEKGSVDNSESWEIEYRLGLILLQNEKNYVAAAARFRLAAAKAKDAPLERYQRVNLDYFLAEALRLAGETSSDIEANLSLSGAAQGS